MANISGRSKLTPSPWVSRLIKIILGFLWFIRNTSIGSFVIVTIIIVIQKQQGGSRILERGGPKLRAKPEMKRGEGSGEGLGEPLPRKFLKIWNDNRAIWCTIFGVKFNHFKSMSAAIKSTLISVEWNYKTNIPQSVPSLNRRIISQSHINNPTYRLQCQLELQPCTAARVAGEAFRQQAFSCSMCWGSTDPMLSDSTLAASCIYV